VSKPITVPDEGGVESDDDTDARKRGIDLTAMPVGNIPSLCGSALHIPPPKFSYTEWWICQAVAGGRSGWHNEGCTEQDAEWAWCGDLGSW
jgi:hypothetical protein